MKMVEGCPHCHVSLHWGGMYHDMKTVEEAFHWYIFTSRWGISWHEDCWGSPSLICVYIEVGYIMTWRPLRKPFTDLCLHWGGVYHGMKTVEEALHWYVFTLRWGVSSHEDYWGSPSQTCPFPVSCMDKDKSLEKTSLKLFQKSQSVG